MIFGNFPLGGGWKIFGIQGGAGPLGEGLQNLGGAEDFDEFCKTVIDRFSKIK